MKRIAAELITAGESPYLIPTGGSVPRGAAGYALAIPELLTQLAERDEAPSHLYFATGSFGTQAGLIAGAGIYSARFTVTGVAVEPIPGAELHKAATLANQTSALLGHDRSFTEADVVLVDGFHGGRYGIPTANGRAAIELLARTEAIFLDPVYSAKAMAGLLAHVRDGHFATDSSVVFLHTGGAPSVFSLDLSTPIGSGKRAAAAL
jgi:1-aminocyclopropane-1-carboxylate deaminase/D-cysteine desulfhydrase-like pyridoxal-dependent ACC family enzyme